MDFYFEIYLLKDELAKDHWQKLYAAIIQYGGRLEKFDIIVSVRDNVVRFLLLATKI